MDTSIERQFYLPLRSVGWFLAGSGTRIPIILGHPLLDDDILVHARYLPFYGPGKEAGFKVAEEGTLWHFGQGPPFGGKSLKAFSFMESGRDRIESLDVYHLVLRYRQKERKKRDGE